MSILGFDKYSLYGIYLLTFFVYFINYPMDLDFVYSSYIIYYTIKIDIIL